MNMYSTLCFSDLLASWEWVSEWFDDLRELMAAKAHWFEGLAIMLVGFMLAKSMARLSVKLAPKKMPPQRMMLLTKACFYGISAVGLLWGLHHVGFDYRVMLGATGILAVAIGFASQTSASNLISGLFLIVEGTFKVGDLITVGNESGTVVSIDLLSTRLRTFDNLIIRIPNETIMKAQVTNKTHFPLRRIDMPLGVAYKEDLEEVKAVLMALADGYPKCFEEPAPLFIVKGFGESSVDLQFSVWAKRENFLEVRNHMFIEIKKAFEREGIEIPFPHRTLYTGLVTKPWPVSLEEDRAVDQEDA